MSETQKTVRLIYFAWVRERVGVAEETVTLPPTIKTIEDLMAWLSDRNDQYKAAFANQKFIRVAIDQSHCPSTAPIANANEIAFFPPVTGG